ncbi:HD domain-containing protein [uncultured Winogradskyella sp.]|uniref:HD domain-containing protein n=1 Tax=uncultured Winogradskyella sp. TaxID=395353 RepID=UPI0035152A74
MTTEDLIETTITFVKARLKGAEGGHDWFHTERVYKNSLAIAKHENVNILVVSLAALLHDIADSKFHDGNEAIGPDLARAFLTKNGLEPKLTNEVVEIIKSLSFKNTFEKKVSYMSEELKVVQDADRLDAMGAIGIARCFNYGGFKNRVLYDPTIPPNLNMTKEEYKNAQGPTINHFYEKLLLLKDQMTTETGKKLAVKRHEFMERYLEQFFNEWQGKI